MALEDHGLAGDDLADLRLHGARIDGERGAERIDGRGALAGEYAGASASVTAGLGVGANALVGGSVTRLADGRYDVRYKLWDVVKGADLGGQSMAVPQVDLRLAAHRIADAVYERLTGEKGYFDSRVVFVDESGPKDRRVKRLAIMDQDGANVRYLTRGDDLVVTPRFSPSTQEITYMSYGQREPRVVLLNIETGQREIVGNFPGMSFAPRFSPDGQRIIMSLQQGGNSRTCATPAPARTQHSTGPMRLN